MNDALRRPGRAPLDARRRLLALGLPLGALALAGGCVTIGGGDAQSPSWYLLEDGSGAPAAAAPGAPIGRVLLIAPVLASGFDQSNMLAYSRQPGTRAHYQFAGWTQRPAQRIGALVERRLAARGRFAAVAQTTAGVRGDMVLNLTLEHLYHDVSVSPGRARVALRAELVDWHGRSLVARRGFEQGAPVAREDAAAAVDAINLAFAALLDEFSPWVEDAVRGAPARG